MNRVRLRLAIGTLFLAAMPGSAAACDFASRGDDPASIQAYARDIVRSSSAIIDAEVVVPSRGSAPARLRPLRVLKGPTRAVYLVAERSTCDIGFLRAGARLRVALYGGPDTFGAHAMHNGGATSRAGRLRLNAAIDTLFRAPRPAGVAGLGGE